MRPERSAPNITFIDESVLPSDQIRVWDRRPMNKIGEHRRQVRLGDAMVCSFAYGITWQAAIPLLKFVKGGGTAFDVELNNACKDMVSCIGVNPELMHQAKVLGHMGLIDKANNRKGPFVNSEQEGRLITPNIPYSTRCNIGRSEDDRVQCLPIPRDF